MGKWIKYAATVNADTLYLEKKLIAQDVKISLPEIAMQTATIQAMGNMDIPIRGLLENMETTITKIGIDKGIGKLNTPASKNIELRWVQEVVQSDGTMKPEGCKVFMRIVPKTIFAGADVEVGSSIENAMPFTVTKFKLVAGGESIIEVDRFAHKLKVNGKDYYSNINKYL